MLTKQYKAADGIFYYTEEKNAIADVCLCITAYEGMESDIRQSLTEYLRQRTKGRRDESAWEALKWE